MSRKPRIRIRDKDIRLIRKLNKAVSNKKSRLRREKNVEVDKPTFPIKDFKGKTRQEFNQYVKEMKAFTSRKSHRYTRPNKHGVSLPLEEVEDVQKQVQKINKQRAKERKRVEKKAFKDRGKETPFTAKEQRVYMGDPRFDALKPLQFNKDRFRSKKEFDEYAAKMKERKHPITSKYQLYKANYIKALQNIFGSMSEPLQEHIKDMKPRDFADMYYSENIANIQFIYDFLDAKSKYEQLKGVFHIA